MYACFAVAIAVIALVALRVRVLRRFDTDVPDALPDDVVGYQALTERIAAARTETRADTGADTRAAREPEKEHA
jgi:hypothetical protein